MMRPGNIRNILWAALLLACPMIITQSGVYLGYLFSLGTGLLFGAALLAGLRRASVWLQILSGALLGVLFITRPFDAVLWAVAMGGYGVYTTWRQWGRQVRAVACVFGSVGSPAPRSMNWVMPCPATQVTARSTNRLLSGTVSMIGG